MCNFMHVGASDHPIKMSRQELFKKVDEKIIAYRYQDILKINKEIEALKNDALLIKADAIIKAIEKKVLYSTK